MAAGSGVLVRVPPPDQGPTRYTDLPLYLIETDPANLRGDVGDIDDLVASMREVGLLQPVTVRIEPGSDRYRIVTGHRRYAAAQHLGWTTIKAVVRGEPMPPLAVLEAMFFENTARRNMDPVAEARALRAIFHARRFGSLPQLAIHVGRSLPWVSDRMKLLDLPGDVQDRLSAGDMTLRESTDRARQIRGMPAKASPAPAPVRQVMPPASATATQRPTAPPAAAGIVGALHGEADLLRRIADDFTNPADAALVKAAAGRLDGLADRIDPRGGA